MKNRQTLPWDNLLWFVSTGCMLTAIFTFLAAFPLIAEVVTILILVSLALAGCLVCYVGGVFYQYRHSLVTKEALRRMNVLDNIRPQKRFSRIRLGSWLEKDRLHYLKVHPSNTQLPYNVIRSTGDRAYLEEDEPVIELSENNEEIFALDREREEKEV